MRKRIIPAVLMSLSIVAAACSDDSDTASTTAPSETAAPDATTAPDETAAPYDSAVETTAAGDASECVLDAPLKIGFAADLGERDALAHGRRDILCVGGRHRLHTDRVEPADADGTDLHFGGGAADGGETGGAVGHGSWER